MLRIRKPYAIEPLNPPSDKMERLNKILARSDVGEVTKQYEMGRVTGKCSLCGGLPTQIVKYKIGRKGGAIRIERYCDECLKSVPRI